MLYFLSSVTNKKSQKGFIFNFLYYKNIKKNYLSYFLYFPHLLINTKIIIFRCFLFSLRNYFFISLLSHLLNLPSPLIIFLLFFLINPKLLLFLKIQILFNQSNKDNRFRKLLGFLEKKVILFLSLYSSFYL